MGYEMADRLLSAGADLAVFNRTRSKAEPLVGHGATLVERPQDLSGREVVFTMVGTSEDLLSVTTGDGGVLTGARAPAVLVDCSTVSQAASQHVRAAAARMGCVLLAAPISGNPQAVREGTASVVVSGPEDAVAEVEPYLRALGKSVTRVGDGDSARLVKIAHNLMLGIVTQAMAEVTVLVEKGGVGRREFLAFLNGSVMGSTFTEYKTPALVDLDFTPMFTPVLLRKDLDLGLDAAQRLDVGLPLTEVTRERVQRLIDTGRADEDFAALLLLAAREAGLVLRPEDDTASART
jgi:3-hydroxyisobutyrate dehydrogenase-like beta-hydroxyacid dehydrogenase